MHAQALESGSWGEIAWIAGAVVASLALHASLAAGVSRIPERVHEEPVWIEMAVVTVEPAPLPPEPEPEPKEPEVVDYTPQPTPVTPPPPEPKPAPRPVQGLSNDSFLPGQGTGFDARHGNTVSTKATDEKLELGTADAFEILPFASVTVPPKKRFMPALEVPESVKAAGVQGRVELLLTIDAAGMVIEVKVDVPLSPDADEACKAAISRSRWKPGEKDGAPVVTRGVPYSCRFEQSAD